MADEFNMEVEEDEEGEIDTEEGEEEEEEEETLEIPTPSKPTIPYQTHKNKLVHYEWESAKYKPHARIVSRKAPLRVGCGLGELENIYGLSRYGKLTSPNAILIGRPKDLKSQSGSLIGYELTYETGKYKPNALILSRPKRHSDEENGPRFVNIYGWTRFGKANPPRPVILSRHVPRDRGVPGPKYDPKDRADTRIPITMKGRWEKCDGDSFEPGPNAYILPSLNTKPAVTFKSRHYFADESQSPGPIYDTRDQKERKKGLSMTFKPFPVHEDYITVGPTDYGTLPGEQAIQQTKIRYPTIKFGKDYSPDYEPPPFKGSLGPGPAVVNLADTFGTSKDKPHAIIISRPKMRPETCGSGRLVNLFGKTRFGAPLAKRPLVIGRHPKKDKFEPGPGAYDPYKYVDKKVGITIKSRLPDNSLKYKKGLPGPGQYNLPTFMGKGPAYSIVKKYFHNLEGVERVPTRKELDFCCNRDKNRSAECNNNNSADNEQEMGKMMDDCIQHVKNNKNNSNWDPASLNPFLEQLALS